MCVQLLYSESCNYVTHSVLSTAAGAWHTLVIDLGFGKQFTISVDVKTGRYVAHLPPMSEPAPVTPTAANDLLNRSAASSVALVVTLIQQVPRCATFTCQCLKTKKP